MRIAKLKKILSINIYLLIFAFIFNVNSFKVFAGNDFGVHALEQKKDKLNIAFSGVNSPKENEAKVSIGDQEFSVDKITNAGKYKDGVSYVFVVDVSGSIDYNQYTFMKDIMKSIVDDGNTAGIKILLVGKKVVAFDMVSGGKDAMKASIDSIDERADEADRNYTSIYQGIVDGLNEANNKEMKLVKAVVVFSDGFEVKENSLTRNEVTDAIKEARVPVFTIPAASGIDVGGGEDTNEILSSFARASLGGVESKFENFSNKSEIVNNIVKAVKNINIAKIDINKLKTGNDTRTLKLFYGDKTDSIDLDISKLKLSSGHSVSNSDETAQAPEEEKKDSFPIVWVVAGVGAIILIVIAVLIIKNMKSGKVTLMFDMGNGYVKKTMKDKFVIGRDSSKADLPMPTDNMLSSMHCMIYMNNKNLYIKDLDSTNGTYLNGKKLSSPQILSKGDIILVGSVEMKFNWE